MSLDKWGSSNEKFAHWEVLLNACRMSLEFPGGLLFWKGHLWQCKQIYVTALLGTDPPVALFRQPAAFTGVIGMKPTPIPREVSRWGLIALRIFFDAIWLYFPTTIREQCFEYGKSWQS